MKYYLILHYLVNITSDHYIWLILCKKERKNSSCLRNGKRAVCNLANETYYEPCSSRDRFSSRWTPSPRDSPISNFFTKAKVSRCSEGLKFTVERTRSSKECSLFFLCQRKALRCEIVLRRIQPCFLPGGVGLFWNATTGQRSFWSRFSGTFRTLWSLKLHFKKRIYVFVNNS